MWAAFLFYFSFLYKGDYTIPAWSRPLLRNISIGRMLLQRETGHEEMSHHHTPSIIGIDKKYRVL